MLARTLGIIACAALLGGCAVGAATSGRVVLQDDNTQVAVSINEQDRTMIADYCGKHRKSLPPGLAKRNGNLPPGLAKRERLPPGLQSEFLPYDLERQLTPLPSGYARVRVG